MNRKTKSFLQIFGLPMLVCVLSIGGLVSALLVEGVADTLAGLGVAVPLVLAGWFCLKGR